MTTTAHHAIAHRAHSLSRRLEKMREKLSGTTAKAVRTLEVSAAALAGGVLQGKAGPEGAHIFHVPVDLGLGLALNVLGYFDAAGDEYSDHLNNLGDGFLASYLSNVGFGWGNTWRTTGKLFGPKAAAPMLAPAAPAPVVAQGTLSPEAMAEIVERVRRAGAPA
jgi:hypothetical protein